MEQDVQVKNSQIYEGITVGWTNEESCSGLKLKILITIESSITFYGSLISGLEWFYAFSFPWLKTWVGLGYLSALPFDFKCYARSATILQNKFINQLKLLIKL